MDVKASEILGTRVVDGGEPNRVPLCVSGDGTLVWCRKRNSPYELVVAETLTQKKGMSWSTALYESGVPFSFGPCKKKINKHP